MTRFFRRACLTLLFAFATAAPAHAALDAATLQSQLDQLNAQGAALLAQARAVRGGQLATPAQLAAVQGASTDYLQNVDFTATQIAQENGFVNVTPQVLVSLTALSANQAALARETTRLGSGTALANLTTLLIGPNANLLATYATILRLSDDIGKMADRIGTMADRILIMADKIGEMADRILITQQIQSANYALAVTAILQTQQNMLTAMQILKR